MTRSQKQKSEERRKSKNGCSDIGKQSGESMESVQKMLLNGQLTEWGLVTVSNRSTVHAVWHKRYCCVFFADRFAFSTLSLWHCWSVVRKSTRPVKLSDEVLVWFSVWSEVQIVCIWSSCNATVIPKPHHLLPDKSWLVLPFWYRLTQVFVEKRPLNGVVVVVVVVVVCWQVPVCTWCSTRKNTTTWTTRRRPVYTSSSTAGRKIVRSWSSTTIDAT